MHKKRLCSSAIEDVKDGRKIKKCHVEKEISTQNNARGSLLEDTLAEEYHPQFLNYMLIGDLVAIMILHSKNLIYKTKSPRPVLYQNFCHSQWSVGDVLNELKSKKNCYPIAKTVILSVGYNDYCFNSVPAVLLAEGIEKIIQKLRKRGCEDIILTNIPPAAAKLSSVAHWKYLQTINIEILRLSEKYDFIGHCNIFKLFGTPKNYFSKNKDYVTFEEINYKVDPLLYNQERRDMISFSDVGKTVLGKHIVRSIENRINFLQQRQINRVICSLEISDSEDVEVITVKKRDPSPEKVIIDLDEDDEKNVNTDKEDVKNIKVDEDDYKSIGHVLDCTCDKCQDEFKLFMKLA